MNSILRLFFALPLQGMAIMTFFLGAALPAFSESQPTLASVLDPIRVKYNLPALAGAIFTTDGVVEMAEQVLDLPARHGLPDFVGGLTGEIDSPAYATVVGTLLYGFHKQINQKKIHVLKDGAPKPQSFWKRWLR